MNSDLNWKEEVRYLGVTYVKKKKQLGISYKVDN